MIVTLLLLAALVLFLLGAFERNIGRVQTTPLGLACLALAMLWPVIAS
jgi:hypothetical protein